LHFLTSFKVKKFKTEAKLKEGKKKKWLQTPVLVQFLTFVYFNNVIMLKGISLVSAAGPPGRLAGR
jgi:hypothetical protein